MRRLLACLVAALALGLGVAAGPASATGATGATGAAAAVPAQDGGPDIIPEPNEDTGRKTNWGGLAVGVGLLVVWAGGGAVLLLRARRRREAPPTD